MQVRNAVNAKVKFLLNIALIYNVLSSSECKMFQDDWMNRKIENATKLDIPIAYGNVIPIRCVDGYLKLTGPDAVTCSENTTFIGLDYIVCFPNG